VPDVVHDVGAHAPLGQDEGGVAGTLQRGRVVVIKAKTPERLVD
jgi:hypothetical protein